jgi:hypothetical protein
MLVAALMFSGLADVGIVRRKCAHWLHPDFVHHHLESPILT